MTNKQRQIGEGYKEYYCVAYERQTTSHTHIHAKQFRVASQPKLHVFGLWEETGTSKGNLSMQKYTNVIKVMYSVKDYNLKLITLQLLISVTLHYCDSLGVGLFTGGSISILSLFSEERSRRC